MIQKEKMRNEQETRRKGNLMRFRIFASRISEQNITV